MSRLLLDAICAELTPCAADVDFLLSLTLLHHQQQQQQLGQPNESHSSRAVASNMAVAAASNPSVQQLGAQTLRWLQRHGFIDQVKNDAQLRSSSAPHVLPATVWRATQLGQAATVSALSPKDAWIVHAHLSLARGRLVLEGGLHALFLITPLHANIGLEWEVYAALLPRLQQQSSSPSARVAELVGIDAGQVDSWRHNPPSSSSATASSLQFHTYARFFLTLVLQEYLQWEDMEISTRVAQHIDKSVPTSDSGGLATTPRAGGAALIYFTISLLFCCFLCAGVCCSSCRIPPALSVIR
jgi:hypothetical protein